MPTSMLYAAFQHYRSLIAKPEESISAFVSTTPPTLREAQPEIATQICSACKLDPAPLTIKEQATELFFWEGACCLVDDTGAIIITRPKTEPYIIAHECIHGLRYRLHSPLFEEFFAYEISKELFSAPQWRTVAGPLFQSSYEVIITIASFWIPLLAIVVEQPIVWTALTWPLFLIGRLAYRRYIWKTALDIIRHVWPQHYIAILIRLHDNDIQFLARLTKENAKEAIQKRSDWRLNSLLFFNDI